jgi:hypothetical protein
MDHASEEYSFGPFNVPADTAGEPDSGHYDAVLPTEYASEVLDGTPDEREHIEGKQGFENTDSDGEHLFALRLPPHTSPDQLRALGALAATFGWELTPVEAEEIASRGELAAIRHSLAKVNEAVLDPGAIAYMENYTALKEKLDNVAKYYYSCTVDARKSFTAVEEKAFREAGYKSVVELASTFGLERATVYMYEDAPDLPVCKVVYVSFENNAKQKPSVLRTFEFHASGGTQTWQRYVSRSFGRVELEPPNEENQNPMDQYNLANLDKLLFSESPTFERVRNGTWERNDD